ncbi:LexA family protein [Pseudanabaena sp. PCC 6802]|uniref:LexA family protein n=1 Tax=Pseudanabaena sp. PCC 6802 TaxID=118173 RepID=UPI00034C0C87|nr:translesion error-prone DNA polymerase V autoproteolytic subunit [Pseudanabaena sp. PCC 6802]
MARGGKRVGAGRPKGTGKYGEETKAVRLPVRIADKILASLQAGHDVLGALSIAEPEPAPQPQTVTLTLVESIYKPDLSTRYRVPLYMNPVAAGFPAPTEDYVEAKLDLNKHLIKHPEASFMVRVTGYSMIDAGIHPGDLLIVDRSLEPTNNKVIIAVVNGELTVKRIRKTRGKLLLMPENDSYEPIQIYPETEFHIWGVVTNVIHPL